MRNFTGRIIRDYEFHEFVGEGGFGSVYKAWSKRHQAQVAIKILLPDSMNKKGFERHFRREVQTLKLLEHPHIVPIYDFWEHEDGIYLALKWIDNGNIRSYLNEHGDLSLPEIIPWIEQVASALSYIHERGIVHRDIKPENILLDSNKCAYLSDFGLARNLNTLNSSTEQNTIVGSVAYLSPEQVTGEPVSPRSDIYSLGIVVYELLMGSHPFPDTSPMNMMLKHYKESIPSVRRLKPQLHAGIDIILARATEKNPLDRYVGAKEFAQALASLIDQPTYRVIDVPVHEQNLINFSGMLQAHIYQNPDLILEKPRRMIGRAALIGKIQEALDLYNLVLIQGLGGMGKTALAAMAAAEYLKQNESQVIWLEAGHEPVESLFRAIAQTFHYGHILALPSRDEQILAVRELLLARKGLLVLDNVWNEDALYHILRAVPDTMPVIITTRSNIPVEGCVIRLQELDEDSGLQLLLYHAGADYPADEALNLCRSLGFHPFAIQMAGKHLKAYVNQTPDDLLHKLGDMPHQIGMPTAFSNKDRYKISHLLEESIHRLHPRLRQHLFMLGGLFTTAVSIPLLACVLHKSVEDVLCDLHELERFGLLSVFTAADVTPHYRLHDLTYSYLFSAYRANIGEYDAILSDIQGYTHTFCKQYQIIDFDLNTILRAADYAQRTDNTTALVSLVKDIVLEGFYNARGYTPLMLTCLDAAITVSLQSENIQSDTYCRLILIRGDIYVYQNDLNGARQCFERGLSITPDPVNHVKLLNAVANVLFRQGVMDYLPYLEQAQDIARIHDLTQEYARTALSLGMFAYMQKQYETAYSHLTNAHTLAQSVSDYNIRFFTLYYLCLIEVEQKRYADALVILPQAADIATCQTNYYWTALTETTSARIYDGFQDKAKAEQASSRAKFLAIKYGQQNLIAWITDFARDNSYAVV